MAAVSALKVTDVPTNSKPAPLRDTDKQKTNGDVTAQVTYTVPPPSGEELFFTIYQGEKPGGKPNTNVSTSTQSVRIRNLRNSPERFSLHEQGFQLEKLVVPDTIDWTKDDQIKAVLYPLVEKLIKDSTDATRVHIFDHTLRKGTMRNPDAYFKTPARQPVPRVHVDYTLKSGPSRLKELLPDEADRLSKTPFAVIQVWRPLKGPVDDAPLALVDARSVSPDDFMQNRLNFPDRTGYTYSIKHNPAHQFYYAEGINVDEAYVFKCYDSRRNTSRFGPHTAFHNPNTAEDAPERESIELRAYAFWEDLEPEEIAYDF